MCMVIRDPVHRKAVDHAYYLTRKASQIRRVRDHRSMIRKWFAEYKQTLRCVTCGCSDPRVLEFHHRVHSEKKYTVSKMINQGNFPAASILKEAAKCDVLCANCHRRLHWKDAITVHRK